MNTSEPKPAQAGPTKAKAKPKIPRQPMPEQDPRRRRTNFEEVPRGYTEETAMLEASRCIQCKKPGCVAGCPVNINIPAFIKKIAEGKFVDALIKLKEQTALPAVCGLEFALQAAAMHGALRDGRAPRGYVAVLRDVAWNVERLDDPALGELRAGARLVGEESGGVIYDLELTAETGATLLRGRAVIAWPKPA